MMMMMRMMMKMSLWLLLLGLAVTSAAAAGPGSCVARCGEVFTRGQQCTCDFRCLQYNECCPDFETTCTTAQSCLGRCSEPFRRGQLCECDPQCTHHNTCCPDYQLHCDAGVSASHPEALLPLRAAAAAAAPAAPVSGQSSSTTTNQQHSFPFSARLPSLEFVIAVPDLATLCSCLNVTLMLDNRCVLTVFIKAIPVSSSSSGNQKSKSKKKANSESEEKLTAGPGGSKSRPSTLQDVAQSRGLSVVDAGSEGAGAGVGLLPLSIPGSPHSPAPADTLPSYGVPSQGGGAPVSPSGRGAVGGGVNGQLVLSPEGGIPYGSSQDARLQAQQDIAQALGLSLADVGPEGPEAGIFIDVGLCSDSPINGLTALSNGTILIFKGELFWSVDPVSHEAGLPQSITDTLGVSSPIDTVFTRWSCDRNTNTNTNTKTYIIKGDQFWSLDGNMVVEPGYPKPLASEFPGLTGTIRAALVVPATKNRPETVHFFKDGNVMQSFTYPPCTTKPRSSLKKRLTRQAGLLSGEINIKVSLKGFPSPITSALTMPNPQKSDRFFHYLFSGPLFFRVQIVSGSPAMAKPDPSAPLAPLPILGPAATAANSANMAPHNVNRAAPANSIKVWLGCP
ncbi:proteoglycan 4-like [Seriola dumerili]|uniref:proteoglycan 4-like n=1 Tax=Seriola dumerili TaxID=41447 RepID=UPI000BBEFE38|nr:proteoglycan 4-like [Seriola dumerili]